MDYDAACRDAATRQGLDPITEALGDAGVAHAVEQTGGFCMVVTVPEPDGTYAITAEEDGSVYRCWFPGTSWHDGAETDAHEVVLTAAQFASWVRTLQPDVTLPSGCTIDGQTWRWIRDAGTWHGYLDARMYTAADREFMDRALKGGE